jgi:ankyrin repeat protein
VALSYATNFCMPDVCTFLLNRGADATHQDRKGNTPLHWCIDEANEPDAVLDTLAVLLDHHALDVNCKNLDGRTALGSMLACYARGGRDDTHNC